MASMTIEFGTKTVEISGDELKALVANGTKEDDAIGTIVKRTLGKAEYNNALRFIRKREKKVAELHVKVEKAKEKRREISKEITQVLKAGKVPSVRLKDREKAAVDAVVNAVAEVRKYQPHKYKDSGHVKTRLAYYMDTHNLPKHLAADVVFGILTLDSATKRIEEATMREATRERQLIEAAEKAEADRIKKEVEEAAAHVNTATEQAKAAMEEAKMPIESVMSDVHARLYVNYRNMGLSKSDALLRADHDVNGMTEDEVRVYGRAAHRVMGAAKTTNGKPSPDKNVMFREEWDSQTIGRKKHWSVVPVVHDVDAEVMNQFHAAYTLMLSRIDEAGYITIKGKQYTASEIDTAYTYVEHEYFPIMKAIANGELTSGGAIEFDWKLYNINIQRKKREHAKDCGCTSCQYAPFDKNYRTAEKKYDVEIVVRYLTQRLRQRAVDAKRANQKVDGDDKRTDRTVSLDNERVRRGNDWFVKGSWRLFGIVPSDPYKTMRSHDMLQALNMAALATVVADERKRPMMKTRNRMIAAWIVVNGLLTRQWYCKNCTYSVWVQYPWVRDDKPCKPCTEAGIKKTKCPHRITSECPSCDWDYDDRVTVPDANGDKRELPAWDEIDGYELYKVVRDYAEYKFGEALNDPTIQRIIKTAIEFKPLILKRTAQIMEELEGTQTIDNKLRNCIMAGMFRYASLIVGLDVEEWGEMGNKDGVWCAVHHQDCVDEPVAKGVFVARKVEAQGSRPTDTWGTIPTLVNDDADNDPCIVIARQNAKRKVKARKETRVTMITRTTKRGGLTIKVSYSRIK